MLKWRLRWGNPTAGEIWTLEDERCCLLLHQTPGATMLSCFQWVMLVPLCLPAWAADDPQGCMHASSALQGHSQPWKCTLPMPAASLPACAAIVCMQQGCEAVHPHTQQCLFPCMPAHGRCNTPWSSLSRHASLKSVS